MKWGEKNSPCLSCDKGDEGVVIITKQAWQACLGAWKGQTRDADLSGYMEEGLVTTSHCGAARLGVWKVGAGNDNPRRAMLTRLGVWKGRTGNDNPRRAMPTRLGVRKGGTGKKHQTSHCSSSGV